MKKMQNNIKLLILLGITLFTQALTSLIGGTLFLSPFSPKEVTPDVMLAIPDKALTIYLSITLYVITSMVIIILAVIMYQLGNRINKSAAIIGLCFYIFEAIMLVIGQVFAWGLLQASMLFVTNSAPYLLDLGTLFITCKEFLGSMAMIPFGFGAIIFYYLLMKAHVFPKWLGIWALITVPFILFGVPLNTFGMRIPFIFFLPYVPFEFFAGIYILLSRNKLANILFQQNL